MEWTGHLEKLEGKWRQVPLFAKMPSVGLEIRQGCLINETIRGIGESRKLVLEEEAGNGYMNSGRLLLKTIEGPSEEYVYHEEAIGETRIPILSEVTFEYDGRGRIIFREYVPEEDIPLIPEGFESSVRKAMNNRTAPSMRCCPPEPAGARLVGMMGSFMGSSMLTNGFGPLGMTLQEVQTIQNQQNPPTAETKWTFCPNCGARVMRGKFCGACGSPMENPEEQSQ